MTIGHALAVLSGIFFLYLSIQRKPILIRGTQQPFPAQAAVRIIAALAGLLILWSGFLR